MELEARVTVIDGVRKVDLPTYRMVGPIDEENGTVMVDVDDDEVEDGQLSEARMRAKYRGLSRVDTSDLGARLERVAPGRVRHELRGNQ